MHADERMITPTASLSGKTVLTVWETAKGEKDLLATFSSSHLPANKDILSL
jgi:hypothetical protein